MLNGNSKKHVNTNDLLNTDLLMAILDNMLPDANKDLEEHYSAVLDKLTYLGINSVESLESFIEKNSNQALEQDRKRVKEYEDVDENFIFDPAEGLTTRERQARGVFYTYTGLLRVMMESEFGEEKISEMKNLLK